MAGPVAQGPQRRSRTRSAARALKDRPPDILQALGDEHKYQARLLNLLERQVGLLNQRQQPDYEVMAGVMRYMTRYPDRFHHPKEDLLFEKIVARDPTAKPRIDEILQDHREIIGEGARLLEAIARCRAGGAAADTYALRKSAHAYIGSLRRHMDFEFLHLFPLAEKVLRPEDWAEVDRRMKPILDPVFGKKVSAGFKPLREAEAAEPEVGAPGQLGVALIEAAALIETIATLIAGITRMRRDVMQQQRQALHLNAELLRQLMSPLPMDERVRAATGLVESNLRLMGENRAHMVELWSEVWSSAWRPYEEGEGPYAPRLLRRRRKAGARAAT